MPTISSGSLRSFFSLTASKLVRDTEVNPDSSNSHEFNGTVELKEFLGRTRFGEFKRLSCRFLYFSDDREVPLTAEAILTWYKPHRSQTRTEWRLYYDDNAIVGKKGIARAGDLMIFAFSKAAASTPVASKESDPAKGKPVVWGIIAQEGSVSEREIIRLFGVSQERSERLKLDIPPEDNVDAVGRQLLECLGITLSLPGTLADDWADKLAAAFGSRMPSVVTFSNFAASTLDLDFVGNPDGALVAWWEREDLLFRIHDRELLKRPIGDAFERMKAGEDLNVEELRTIFMSSMQTARSRAGAAFENQLSSILRKSGIKFDARLKTSTGDKPDFLFPSLDAYENSPEVDLLTMLAAKTTCKERWQQVLAEAPKVPKKHLTTMSAAIPPDQLKRMRDMNLTLVLPEARHADLTGHSAEVITIREFIELVRTRQGKISWKSRRRRTLDRT